MEDQLTLAGGETAMAIRSSTFLPVMDLETALYRRTQLLAFIDKCMTEGEDYGHIPGMEPKAGDKRKARKTLLKPGAEKLCNLFGLEPKITFKEQEMDWTGANHGGEPFFYFLYRFTIYRDGRCLGEGEGSCNSWEKKYRYRNGERKCPACGAAAIIKGKAEYGGGWLCFDKKGGCKAKFADNDPQIVAQQVGQVPNLDIADIVNTLQKMSQKRALVAGVLVATGTSDLFTQDEDRPIDDTQTTTNPLPAIQRELPPTQVPSTVPAARATPTPQTTNAPSVQTGKAPDERLKDMQAAYRGLEEVLGIGNFQRQIKAAGYQRLEDITDIRQGMDLYKLLLHFVAGVKECRAYEKRIGKEAYGRALYVVGLVADPAEAESIKDLNELHAALVEVAKGAVASK